jgi:hypothetical protein
MKLSDPSPLKGRARGGLAPLEKLQPLIVIKPDARAAI